jgi:hypothetical protein
MGVNKWFSILVLGALTQGALVHKAYPVISKHTDYTRPFLAKTETKH